MSRNLRRPVSMGSEVRISRLRVDIFVEYGACIVRERSGREDEANLMVIETGVSGGGTEERGGREAEAEVEPLS